MNHLDPNSTAVPEVLEYITTKFVNDSGLYEQLQNLLKMVVSHLYTKSLSHGSFCDKIETPDGITIKLLQLFGTEVGQRISKKIWTNSLLKNYKESEKRTLSSKKSKRIVTL